MRVSDQGVWVSDQGERAKKRHTKQIDSAVTCTCTISTFASVTVASAVKSLAGFSSVSYEGRRSGLSDFVDILLIF